MDKEKLCHHRIFIIFNLWYSRNKIKNTETDPAIFNNKRTKKYVLPHSKVFDINNFIINSKFAIKFETEKLLKTSKVITPGFRKLGNFFYTKFKILNLRNNKEEHLLKIKMKDNDTSYSKDSFNNKIECEVNIINLKYDDRKKQVINFIKIFIVN